MKLFSIMSAIVIAASFAFNNLSPCSMESVPEEPVMTEPYHQNTDESTEQIISGLSLKNPEITLNVGESCQLFVNLDSNIYQAQSLRFDTKNNSAVTVSSGGVITARSEGTALIYVTAKLQEDAVILSPTAMSERTVTAKVTVLDNSRTAEQKTALKILEEKEECLFCEFQRERAVILGKLSSDAPRLTLEQTEQIIEDSDSFSDVMQAIIAKQEYPDSYGGSGMTLIEYWFDKRGMEKILITLEQEDILYIQLDDDGNMQEWKTIYPTTQYDYQRFDAAMFDMTYRIFNDIHLRGDANEDKCVDVSDAVLTARLIAADSGAYITSLGKRNADVDADGRIDSADVITILRIISKII